MVERIWQLVRPTICKHRDRYDAEVSGDIEMMVMLEAQFLHER